MLWASRGCVPALWVALGAIRSSIWHQGGSSPVLGTCHEGGCRRRGRGLAIENVYAINALKPDAVGLGRSIVLEGNIGPRIFRRFGYWRDLVYHARIN